METPKLRDRVKALLREWRLNELLERIRTKSDKLKLHTPVQ